MQKKSERARLGAGQTERNIACRNTAAMPFAFRNPAGSSQSGQSEPTRLAADQRQITYQSHLVSMCFVLRALALRCRNTHGLYGVLNYVRFSVLSSPD